jgi:GWxTD domain-containing protein
VVWIITDTEAQAFKHLSNDEERDSFIENFWQRRNPNPDSPDNEYRDEIYARIAYANEHFAAGKPGWMTDRGHIYIAYGKPDDIDSHPSGGSYQRPMEEGGGETRPSRLRCGTTGISKASATTSIWSLWIPASAGTTTTPSTGRRRMR